MESERYERVMAAIRRKVPDRVPWAIWGHFPAVPFLKHYSWEKANRDGEESAKAHLAFLRELDYKMDLLKVTPFFRSMAYHWGSRFRFTDNTGRDETLDVVVKSSEDWEKLWVLDPRKELRENLRCVEILARDLSRMPFIYTVASPMIQALHGISKPEHVYKHMKENPSSLKEGLETITQTCIDFAQECIKEGASGFFFGMGGRGEFWSKLNRKQLEEYALYYDKKVLKSIDAPIKLLHICNTINENPQKDGGLMQSGWFKEYPVDAINWWDRHFTPCTEAKKIYGDKFCLMTGLDHRNTLRNGTPEQIINEAKNAIDCAKKDGGFILAPGCAVPVDTPLVNYNAVGRAVEKYGQYRD